jgi:hypothetical protein
MGPPLPDIPITIKIYGTLLKGLQTPKSCLKGRAAWNINFSTHVYLRWLCEGCRQFDPPPPPPPQPAHPPLPRLKCRIAKGLLLAYLIYKTFRTETFVVCYKSRSWPSARVYAFVCSRNLHKKSLRLANKARRRRACTESKSGRL